MNFPERVSVISILINVCGVTEMQWVFWSSQFFIHYRKCSVIFKYFLYRFLWILSVSVFLIYTSIFKNVSYVHFVSAVLLSRNAWNQFLHTCFLSPLCGILTYPPCCSCCCFIWRILCARFLLWSHCFLFCILPSLSSTYLKRHLISYCSFFCSILLML